MRDVVHPFPVRIAKCVREIYDHVPQAIFLFQLCKRRFKVLTVGYRQAFMQLLVSLNVAVRLPQNAPLRVFDCHSLLLLHALNPYSFPVIKEKTGNHSCNYNHAHKPRCPFIPIPDSYYYRPEGEHQAGPGHHRICKLQLHAVPGFRS